MFTLHPIMQRQTYKNLKRHEAQFLSVTGFSLTCFDRLFFYSEVMPGINQPQTNVWIHLLKTILLQTLRTSKSLPCRDFESLQKFFRQDQNVFIDGSERPISRPSDDEVQKEFPVTLWEDLEFTGLNPDNAVVKRPIKKPRKREPDAGEKAFIRQILSKIEFIKT